MLRTEDPSGRHRQPAASSGLFLTPGLELYASNGQKIGRCRNVAYAALTEANGDGMIPAEKTQSLILKCM